MRTYLRFVTAVLALGLTSSGGQAASLISVGVLDPANPSSVIQALSSDGSYAVGTSKIATDLSVPVVWSLADGLVALPNPSGKSSLAHGVAVGIGSNLGNIMISGLHEGNLTHRFYKAPLTHLAGGAWKDTATEGGLGTTSNVRGGTSNVLRNQIKGDGRWYVAGKRNDNNRVARFRGDPDIGWDGVSPMTGESVSGYGVVVGRYTGVSPSMARWDSPQGDTGDVPGSGGDARSDGIGISASFGKSTTVDFEVQWICGQDQSAPGPNMQAFRWNRGDASLTLLGTLPGATSSVAYTVADNGVSAGRSHFGNASPTYEVATVWDALGMPQSLQVLLEAAGVDTSEWQRLTRVFAVSDDGTVFGGYGVWAADGSNRGFVARVDNLPTVGACCVIGFGSNTCTITTEEACNGIFTPNTSCAAAGCGPCMIPWADADSDGDVDQKDFGAIQACFTGTMTGVPNACACFDRVKDQMVNGGDLEAFMGCFTGPDVAFDANHPPEGCDPGTGQLP
ncbi:MAG TPA: hypothetical protein PKY77_00025 [Phycisphaerae bacterium]|nr:hypothetical protein [Phycisphaerae bacterium]HRY69655.1 hypothetical protein [Phycisphaerae bacterium]HSA29653.1 hypothetical protein [Phycisphaerae bacterium]